MMEQHKSFSRGGGVGGGGGGGKRSGGDSSDEDEDDLPAGGSQQQQQLQLQLLGSLPAIKLMLLGDCEVGKTLFALRYLNVPPPCDSYLPTVFDNWSAKEPVDIDGTKFRVDFWDTTGLLVTIPLFSSSRRRCLL